MKSDWMTWNRKTNSFPLSSIRSLLGTRVGSSGTERFSGNNFFSWDGVSGTGNAENAQEIEFFAFLINYKLKNNN